MRGEHNESAIFEELFLAWCVPRGQTEVQDYLEHDPGRAYGQYAFEPGDAAGGEPPGPGHPGANRIAQRAGTQARPCIIAKFRLDGKRAAARCPSCCGPDYTAICSMTKHSMISPSLMSLNFSMDMPHSYPEATSLTASLNRCREASCPSWMTMPSRTMRT